MDIKKARSLAMIVILTATAFTLISVPIETQAQRGPKIDRLRLKVIRSPDPQVLAMLDREIDVLTRIIRPSDFEALQSADKTVTSTPGFGFYNFMYNLRPTFLAGPEFGKRNPLHDVNFRHALAHLMPKARIVAMLRNTVDQLDTMVPHAQAE